MARVVRRELLENKDAHWMRLQRVIYKDDVGKERTWEMAERTTRRGGEDGLDAVCMAGVQGDKVILVRQFRPPVGKYVIGKLKRREFERHLLILSLRIPRWTDRSRRESRRRSSA